jgi:hypothetical protein
MIAIRPAIADDIPQLARLMQQQVELQRTFDSSWETDSDLDWIAYLSARLRRRHMTIVVADDNGSLVGYMDVQIVQQDRALSSGGLKLAMRVPAQGTAGGGRLRQAIKSLTRRQRQPPISMFKPKRYGFMNDIYAAS